ncbi:hypothetical protein K8O93_03340 [Gordonia bronchialis]|uniref:hypothetical protein n=1 Tax=Gordonia bronchialis TaxID=2054 RepID=UPI001CBB05F2|nr:hypothetical protein [Gordonia bronchialis]UAK38813.1 hypothetical protein K8O93_03340 [Gordonia bronchialis]
MRASEIKFSLHSSGYRQFGYTGKARDRLRAGDRHAVRQWNRGKGLEVTGWDIGLVLMFADSELRSIPGGIGDDVLQIPAGPEGIGTAIAVMTAPPGTTTDGLESKPVAMLDRSLGEATVAIVLSYGPFDPALPLRLREEANESIPLVIPGIVNPEPFDVRLGDLPRGGAPRAIEIARDDIESLPALPPFVGEVLPWDECPDEDVRERQLACGLLVFGSDGRHRLYVDQRARCDHSRLGANAQKFIDKVYENGGFDNGWGAIGTGERCTMLSSRPVLAEHKIDVDDGGSFDMPPLDS